ncbi:UNVERIFIED_CONTAM: hypothetical protein PYX00_002134 [Menopon gallinae]|uniref:Uncharacterized protein n=1 Tax=Menopon gallinae TaxID=328185 RepID=A0AAW2IFQ3_9NEOP
MLETMEGRILKPVPAELRVKMDELVHDLTQALEETSCSSSVKIKVGFRRRARSAGNVAWGSQRTTHSDDSISERIHSRGKEVSSFVQSDSDEVSTNSQKRFTPFPLQRRTTNLQQNFESDSVNENFSPLRTGTRRKRKLKRMDVDPVDSNLVPPRPISSLIAKPISAVGLGNKGGPMPGPSGLRNNIAKKKKFLKNPPVHNNQRFETLIGKRKRSARERSTDFEMGSSMTKSSRLQRGLRDDAMELDRELMSSSSLSSSESDAGVYTNDEGREGDDEQSDWFGEARPDEDTDLEQDDPALQSILNGSLDQMSSEARQAYKERIDWLKEGFGEREIRGGRRRVRNLRPGFAVLTSANEKLSRFLQDRDQVTLKLHAMEREEREQLTYLVNLYSLNMRVEYGVNGESCPVISKTSGTPQTVRLEQVKMNINDYKKRRKIPQYVDTGDELSPNAFCEDVMKS